MRMNLKAFAADGITELHTAFSRAEGPKTYVQHQVAAQKERVWSLIEQGATVYVCGDGGKMEPDVKAALVEIYREKSGASADAGRALDRRPRYEGTAKVLDVWAGGWTGAAVVLAKAGTHTPRPLVEAIVQDNLP